jgi:hypothetical protein
MEHLGKVTHGSKISNLYFYKNKKTVAS